MNIAYFRLRGGLGNQLFIYSAALVASESIDFVILDTHTGFLHDKKYNRSNMLAEFIEKSSFIRPSAAICKLLYLLFRAIDSLGIFSLKSFPLLKLIPDNLTSIENNTLSNSSGFFVSKSLHQFSHIPMNARHRLLQSFNLQKNSLDTSVHNINDKVALHLRFFDCDLNACEPRLLSYLDNALSRIRSQCKDVFSVVVFTNDNKQAFNTLKHISNVDFIYLKNSSMSSPWSDLYRISQFEYIILTNSTFGWWGSFFADPEKTHIFMPNQSFDPSSAEGNWNSIDFRTQNSEILNVK